MSKTKISNHVHRLAIDAMLSALFFALSLFSVDLGFIKFTVAPLAILVAGFLFGPADGAIVGLVGSFLEQLIKYGFSVTMPLWMFPAIVRGALVGALAILIRRFLQSRTKEDEEPFTPAKGSRLSPLFVTLCVVCAILSAVVVTLCNTLPLYVDYKIFGWSDENPLLWGVLSTRFVSGMITSAILGVISPLIVIPAAAALERMRKGYLWKK